MDAVTDGVVDLEEGGSDKIVLDGEPVKGMNVTGWSVVDDTVTNHPSGFRGRSVILAWLVLQDI